MSQLFQPHETAVANDMTSVEACAPPPYGHAAMVDPLRTEYTPPPPPPPPPERPGEKQHTVQEGETLQQIADEHHTTPQAILDVNPQVRDPELLNAGEVLNMPDATVDPQVSRTVDAVLSPDASAEQKNEANVRLQD